MQQTLLDNEFCSLSLDPVRRLVTFTRKAAPFPSVEKAREVMEDVARVGRTHTGLEGFSLLVDSRAGPLRNDEGFESMMRERRESMFGRFRRVGMLLRTATGVLQANRVARQSQGVMPGIFQSESEAVAWLTAP
jgi:hypothetical protein